MKAAGGNIERKRDQGIELAVNERQDNQPQQGRSAMRVSRPHQPVLVPSSLPTADLRRLICAVEEA